RPTLQLSQTPARRRRSQGLFAEFSPLPSPRTKGTRLRRSESLCLQWLVATFVLLGTRESFAQRSLLPPLKPNIIFILADDLGYGEVGCYGQQRIKTPNLDRMASEGMRFTQCYAGTTVCAPSRASLMTGLHTGH